MTRRSNLAPLLLAGVLLVGAAVAGRFAMALIAHRYLSTALDLIQQHALKRESVDWVALRAQAHDRAVDALTRAQTYDAIRFALGSLGDHHSGFLEPETLANLTQAAAGSPVPEGRILPSKIGLVLVKSFVAVEQRAIDRHATQLQELIRTVDSAGPCGWILDLRQNGGGNMWPMLAGVGPILGVGKVGAFVDRDGAESAWFYSDGRTQEDVRTRARVIGAPYQIRERAPPVAVLLGPGDGELGRSRGRRLSTAAQHANVRPANPRLVDLERVVPAERWRRDQSDRVDLCRPGGRLYPDGVEPDQPTPPAPLDIIPPAANEWLAGQPPCRLNRQVSGSEKQSIHEDHQRARRSKEVFSRESRFVSLVSFVVCLLSGRWIRMFWILSEFSRPVRRIRG